MTTRKHEVPKNEVLKVRNAAHTKSLILDPEIRSPTNTKSCDTMSLRYTGPIVWLYLVETELSITDKTNYKLINVTLHQ